MKKEIAFTAALAAVVFAGASLAQTPQALTGDYRNPATAEIRGAQGDVLLKGAFAPVDGDDDGEVERLAKLTPAAAATGLGGEAEVAARRGADALHRRQAGDQRDGQRQGPRRDGSERPRGADLIAR